MPKQIEFLPLEHSWQEALKIYAKRLAIFFAVALANIALLVIVRLTINSPIQVGYTLTVLIMGWAAITFFWGSAQWIASGGDYGGTETTRSRIINGAVGFLVGLVLFVLIYLLSK